MIENSKIISSIEIYANIASFILAIVLLTTWDKNDPSLGFNVTVALLLLMLILMVICVLNFLKTKNTSSVFIALFYFVTFVLCCVLVKELSDIKNKTEDEIIAKMQYSSLVHVQKAASSMVLLPFILLFVSTVFAIYLEKNRLNYIVEDEPEQD